MKSGLSSLMYLTLLSLLMAITSCYRMPGENEFSVVPTTNNPSVTYEKSDCILPGMGH